MNEVYKRREGYWGIISLPQRHILDMFAGRMTVDSPEEVEVQIIYHNPQSMSLDIIIRSDKEIKGVTHECCEGEVIPLSDVPFKMNNDSELDRK